MAVGQRLAFFDSFAFKNIPANHHTKDLLPFVEALSKELGTVQYFFTHRVPETHIWVWAESGRIVRAYGYSGERDSVLFDVGPPTAGEKELRLAIPATETTPNEQTVVEVAGRWSIDPTKLDDEQVEGPGVLGTMP